MVTVTQFRNTLQTQLFSKYGKSVTLRSRGAPVYNERGDETDADITTSTVTVVPYDITEQRRTYESFSTHNAGEVAMVVPYTVTVNNGDEVVMESVTYEVKEVVKHYLPDNPVTLIRCAKIVA